MWWGYFHWLHFFNNLVARTKKQINLVDTGRKLTVHKTFRRRPGRLLNVWCTFNLRPVSTGKVLWKRRYNNLLKNSKTFIFFIIKVRNANLLELNCGIYSYSHSLIETKREVYGSISQKICCSSLHGKWIAIGRISQPRDKRRKSYSFPKELMHSLKKKKYILKEKKYRYLYITCLAKTCNWHFKNASFIQTLASFKQ